MTKKEAWDYAIGICKVDGCEPDDEFLELVEKEICGAISMPDIYDALDKQYNER